MNNPSELEQIIEDKTSGSSRIVKRTLDLLMEAEDREEIMSRIVAAHPAMAGLKKISSMLGEKEVENIRSTFIQMDEATSRSGQSVVQGKKWVTFSHSHTAERIFESAEFVYAMKSAPGNEGLETFDYLCLHDVEAELIEDARMSEAVEQCDGVLVGADTLLPDGFINKIGTLPLALVADYYGKPFYVAAASYKKAMELNHKPPFEYIPSRLVERYITE